MDFFPKNLQKYVEDHSEAETDLLKQINRETHLHVSKPRMLSGHLQGRVLSMLSHMIHPKRILELGTYTGYATLCLAEGLEPQGKIITIDHNLALASRTQQYFDKSPFKKQIEMKLGNAMEIVPTLEEEWDLVFIDADKENYAHYFDMVVSQTKKGGFIIADNTLWSGKVSDFSLKDKTTDSIRSFNKKVHADAGVQNVLFPIRDGLMILRKI